MTKVYTAIMLDPEVKKKLMDDAKKKDRSLSSLINLILTEYINNIK